jgi:hypothetical protein
MGASFGGVAGGLFAGFQQFVSPESFTLMESVMVLCMVVLGDPVGGIDEEKGAVEWRLAGGVPFALIVRTKRRTTLDDGREWTSERLAVRGLGDYSEITGDVDVHKTPHANAAARTLADRQWRVHRADER